MGEERQLIKTSSANTVNLYKFLEKNPSEALTLREIAERMEISTPKITAGAVSLAKKGILTRTEELDEKNDKVIRFQFAQPADFTFEEKKTISDKGVQLIEYLKANVDKDLTAADIAEPGQFTAEGTVPIAITGIFNALVKRGLGFREEALVEMPDGEQKVLKFLKLTEEGINFKY